MAQAQARPLQQFAEGRMEMFNTSPQPQPQKVAYTPPPTPGITHTQQKPSASPNQTAPLPTLAQADSSKSASSSLQSLRSKKRSDLSLSNILPTTAEQAAKGVA